MKKFIFVFILLGMTIFYNYGQTYYYQKVAKIDENGVKTKENGGMYITFINNKDMCYESDKDGYRIKKSYGYMGSMMPSQTNWYYIKTKEGTHVYQHKDIYSDSSYSRWLDIFYYFNSDFNKLIHCHPEGEYAGIKMPYWAYEYKRSNGPQDEYDDNIPVF
ncbi:hypothetical protein CLV62_1511 [Dysgonomonas alginatilytica]|uniref:Uncharacterized protein n=1 Tax=Dysgonomonas alginatilytica TaxID=1605892 RepID=A0A2V3PK60_9BACT|nr:hypothetical protein [Dysgonomonas alginatilytica]PXV58106.1 hypothetical protein CLV62_1511 [Dysgonomonas alginatilytica]